jgi:hypothetical protein
MKLVSRIANIKATEAMKIKCLGCDKGCSGSEALQSKVSLFGRNYIFNKNR